MISRELPEWIGSGPDAAIPPRVRVRIFMKAEGRCAECGRPLAFGKWAMDHIIALANGGEHREKNLQPLCVSPCHADKTKTDVAEKSKIAAVRAKHIGIKPRSSRPLPGTKVSGWRKRMSGQVERRT